ncbi:hypothetical protein ACA910_008090 [Epithemia clementina (nom. ined.)]
MDYNDDNDDHDDRDYSVSDPFEMFGPTVDESNNDKTNNKMEYEKGPRDPANGFNSHHPGTEQAMLQFVRNGIASVKKDTTTAKDESLVDLAIRFVDQFCYQRHWMMHIGAEKGPLLERFLAERVQDHLHRQPNSPFIIVEVGTYCGYSSALMARTLLQKADSFHIVTVDVNPNCIDVAQKLHQLAELEESNFSYVLLGGASSAPTLGKCIKSAFADNPKFDQYSSSGLLPPVSFVFLDHQKDYYLSDLKHLEEEGIIRAHCAVAADNVVFFQLNDYREYMQELSNKGVVTTKLEQGQLEYILPEEIDQPNPTAKDFWQDGIEMTIYLQDPQPPPQNGAAGSKNTAD